MFTSPAGEAIFVAWSSSPQTIKYTTAEKVKVIHIIEDDQTKPKVEIAKTTSIRISESPVFIELIE